MTSQQNDSKRHSTHTASAVSQAKHRLGAPPLRARLTMLAAACPMIAQALMMVILLLHGQWLFAAMIAPGIFACLVSLLLTLPSSPGPEKAHAPQQATIDVGITDDADDRAADLRHTPSQPIESLLHFARLPWRTIVGHWLEPLDLAVPVGMTGSEPLTLDLNRQGPHALVAGTTGSGKSVLLQSWCLALASMNGPEHLNFVFLDFKGGSAFRKLERLPHTVGSVCDLDLAHAVRALRALEAELTRREQLSAAVRASDIRDMVNPPPRLIVVIDEFHALKDQLPDYVNRLVRIASLGRSLGMYLIACTQNPMGQVSADMKANMSVSICLRVRDRLQSCELLGDGRAADLSPAMPGAAFCNDSEQVTAFRCATARDIDAVCRQIAFASRFVGSPPQPSLFTAPLPRHVKDRTVADHAPQRIRFGLADDGINLREATVSLTGGNIGVIGPQGRGKTTLLETLARHASLTDGLAVRVSSPHRRVWSSQWLHSSRRMPYASSDAPPPPHIVWFVDDADELFDPFRTDEQALSFTYALADESVSVVFAVSTIRPIRIPEHCNTRIVFPCGERTSDLMAGVPARLLDTMSLIDADNAGRAVLIEGTSACLVQCAS
ncbi:FtsK/SpoIIIE domain-containing protein [Bifidobacterium longum]|uniref:FtsK/SpoIIIE domain-containing protein n=1 Tax=Bifidobacterium longum TaxID=216816 RepID=UPI0020731AD1|nr:FtsK/SpoIIIE domain-containing protein [Bifidobacterium longum]MDW3163569.1 FtsK/SpoIIIE domain-containing protein [Bifidobacterium longum]